MATTAPFSVPTPGARLGQAWERVRAQVNRISPEAGDAVVYFASAVFALITIFTSTNALYQVWGRMALSPFAFGALASLVVALVVRHLRRRQPGRTLTARQHRRAWVARLVVALCVFVGALA